MRTAGQPTEVISGDGVLDQLAALIAGIDPRRVLIVGGRTGLAWAGLAPGGASDGNDAGDGNHPRDTSGGGEAAGSSGNGDGQTRYFLDFTPNPQLADVIRGCALVESYRPDLILGVGGGSAMDVAKMVRLLPADRDRALAALRGEPVLRERPAPLILVPTTAGTGSEVTRFAAVYVGDVKYSLDHPLVHADVALVDPRLTDSCPAEVTYSCALDAFSHALESTWSVRSTTQSRALAGDALRALVPLLRAGGWPVSPGTREALSGAALRAGLAIDLTRTTAGHAFAYPLTARFGVPHGLACALNLRWLLPYTARHLSTACGDPRGPAFVARRLGEIVGALGADTADGAGEVIASFLRSVGFADRLGDYGVRAGDLPGLVAAATGSQRSTNGPVVLAEHHVLPWLRQAL